MKPNRRAVIGGVAAAIVSPSSLLAQSCWVRAIPATHALPDANFPQIDAQQNPVWCWAASTQAIFRAYGRDISQSDILAKAFKKAPIPAQASPGVLLAVLNTTYRDKLGSFSVSTPRYADNFGVLPGGFNAYGMQRGLTNSEIYAELSAGRPLIYASKSHATVLVAMDELCGVPQRAVVLDPGPLGGVYYPGVSSIGTRVLAPQDMFGYFVAKVRVA